jgi:uncharacterized membrane protein (UPF0127 family)
MVELKVKYLKTYREMSVGLLGAVRAENMYFKTRFGIHTFFMKFPIDVMILDRQNRVAAIKKNLKPFRIFFWNPKNDGVVELQEGTIEREKIRVGEQITLISVK